MENLFKKIYIQAGLADCGAILEKKGVDGLVGTVFQIEKIVHIFCEIFLHMEVSEFAIIKC